VSRPGRPGPGFPLLSGTLGGSPDQPDGNPPSPDCCEVDEANIPDRALETNGGYMVALGAAVGGGSSVIQSQEHEESSASHTSITQDFDSPPTEGNTLWAIVTVASSITQKDIYTPSGWQVRLEHWDIGPGHVLAVFTKVAGAAESSTVAVSFDTTARATLVIMETDAAFGGIDVDADVNNTVFSIPSTTPTAGLEALLIAISVATNAHNVTVAPSGYTLVEDEVADDGGSERLSVYSLAVDPTSGSYSSSITYANTVNATRAHAWAGAFPEDWTLPIPQSHDGDDATFHALTGPDLARLDMGAEYRIVRTRLRIDTAAAGSRTYTIEGANEADYSDAVTIATIPFTATGADQTVTATFADNTESYRYYQLSSSSSEAVDLHSWSLYEPTLATNHQHATALDDLTDVDAPTPADGEVLTWVDADSEWQAVAPAGGGGGTVDIEDEGAADTIDFVGAGVSVTFSGGQATVDIPGGSGSALYPVSVAWGVQGGANVTNTTIVMSATPTNGNRILLAVGLLGRDTTSVTQTNVTWTMLKRTTAAGGGNPRTELWVGVVGASASTTININSGSSNWVGGQAVEIADALTPTLGTNTSNTATYSTSNPGLTGIIKPTAGQLVVATWCMNGGGPDGRPQIEGLVAGLPSAFGGWIGFMRYGYAQGSHAYGWLPIGLTQTYAAQIGVVT
jgi:hypothetical protein